MSESEHSGYSIHTALRRPPITMIGKTADVTVEQRSLTDTLYKKGKPQKVTAESCIKTSSWKVGWRGKMWWEKVHKQLGELEGASYGLRLNSSHCV